MKNTFNDSQNVKVKASGIEQTKLIHAKNKICLITKVEIIKRSKLLTFTFQAISYQTTLTKVVKVGL